MNNLHAGMSVRITLTSMGCSRSKVGAVMKWILKDEKRKQEYLEAKLVGSEIMAEEMIDIADFALLINNFPFNDLGTHACFLQCLF
jgi:predicted SpoU family rRNA methylase